MHNIAPCRPSPDIPLATHGLWSLWDMLSRYGFRLMSVIDGLRMIDNELTQQINTKPAQVQFDSLFYEIIKDAAKLAKEIDMPSVARQAGRLTRLHLVGRSVMDTRLDVQQLRIRIIEEAKDKHFLFIPDDLVAYWGKSNPFGEKVLKRFKNARLDIECAAKCLALGEPTACVFHLSRALEAAVRKLSGRLGITITPQTTWRQLTGSMDGKIKTMPETTDRQKRKKGGWETARANLHHVGSAWRNKTMHPATFYTPSQAIDIFNAARVFMTDLCAL
jgi:hypothetical protein